MALAFAWCWQLPKIPKDKNITRQVSTSSIALTDQQPKTKSNEFKELNQFLEISQQSYLIDFNIELAGAELCQVQVRLGLVNQMTGLLASLPPRLTAKLATYPTASALLVVYLKVN